MYKLDLSGKKSPSSLVARAASGLVWPKACWKRALKSLIIGSSNKAAEVAATLNKGEAKCHGLAIDLADAAARAEGFEKAVSMAGR